MADSFVDKWRQEHTDHISESISEFITSGGPEEARNAICDAIMVWQDYHQKELNKWRELGQMLNLPVPTGSKALPLPNCSEPFKIIENRQ